MVRCFFVPGPPQGKGRPRVVKPKNLKHAISYTPKETVLYENKIVSAYTAKYEGQPLADGELRIIVRAIFPVAKSESKKMRGLMLQHERAPTKKPDIDNIIKAVCDALNGVAYTDDANIVTMLVTKEYGNVPGLWVLIDKEWKTGQVNWMADDEIPV